MKLTDDEKSMLDGNEGKAVRKAMELLVRYGEALGAERFVDTNNVTLLSGLFMYPEVVKNAVKNFEMDEIASKFFLDSDETVSIGRVKAFTTNHIFTVNNAYWKNIQRRSHTLAQLAVMTEAFCRGIGVNNTATCSPYLAGNVPVKGQHCAWTESSAIPFANAIIGARTNIEGCHSAFASALTGKTPVLGDAYRGKPLWNPVGGRGDRAGDHVRMGTPGVLRCGRLRVENSDLPEHTEPAQL